jgi:TM2 domain-containing membrane protein YozV
MTDSAEPPHPRERLDLLAGLAAAAIPGAGHIYLGEARRGVLAAIGVLGLFLGGMLLGGIDVIDSREDRLWFYGQALVGPIAFGVDWYHQNRLKAYQWEPGEAVGAQVLLSSRPTSLNPGEERVVGDITVDGRQVTLPLRREAAGAVPPNSKSIGRMNELGTLSATIAGMLNLIIFLDALLPSRPRRPGGSGRAPTTSGAGGEARS